MKKLCCINPKIGLIFLVGFVFQFKAMGQSLKIAGLKSEYHSDQMVCFEITNASDSMFMYSISLEGLDSIDHWSEIRTDIFSHSDSGVTQKISLFTIAGHGTNKGCADGKILFKHDHKAAFRIRVSIYDSGYYSQSSFSAVFKLKD
jgi:hypothetical protein